MEDRNSVYKIRKRKDGKYSNGGCYPRFTRNGKSWSIGDLRKHIQILDSNVKKIYAEECEIVAFTESKTLLTIADI